MDNELKDRLVASVDKITEWVEAGGDFVAEQAPLIAKEIVAWGIAGAIVRGGIFLSILLIVQWGCWYVRKLIDKGRLFNDVGSDDPIRFFTWVFQFVSPLLLIGVAVDIYTLVYIWVAPRLYILEELSRLLRNINR